MRTLAFVPLLLAAAVAEEAPRLTWQHEGYAALPAAADEAKRKERRLLVGLSGSDG